MRKSLITLISTSAFCLATLVSCKPESTSLLTVSDTQLNFTSAAGSKTVLVSSNLSWTVGSTADWCTITPRSGTGSGNITVAVSENVTNSSRYTTFIVSVESTFKLIYVSQAAGSSVNVTVEVPVVGGLQKALEGRPLWQIKTLKISGNLNSVDFHFMRDQIIQLEELDLRGVRLVEDKIPDRAFHVSDIGNRYLHTIWYPSSLKEIGRSAFFDCRALRNNALNFPAGVEQIGEYAFAMCTSFSGPLTLPSLEVIAEGLFLGCTGFTGSLKVPPMVKEIGRHAFNGCTGLSGTIELNTPELSKIGYAAFLNNRFTACKITATTPPVLEAPIFDAGMIVYVPTGTREEYVKANIWGQYLVVDNNDLITVSVEHEGTLADVMAEQVDPTSVSRLCVEGWINEADYTFMRERMPLLTHVDLSMVKTKTIPANAFKGRTSLREVILPTTLERINARAFEGCSRLSGTLTLPSSLEYIGDYAFNDCIGFSALTLSSSLKQIGSFAFYKCTGLKGALNIPGSVELIKDNAFRGCISFTSLTIENAPLTIEEYAFADCEGLEKIACKLLEPPTSGVGLFFMVDKIKCVLYVPTASIAAYKSNIHWGAFIKIVGI